MTETATDRMLSQFTGLQGLIDDIYLTAKGDKFLIRPCDFFNSLTMPHIIIPPGQKSKNLNIKVVDGDVEFDEVIDLENSLNAQIKIPYNKIGDNFDSTAREILGAISAIEQRFNRYLCNEKVDTSKKYYLLFYNQSLSDTRPIVGGNYLMARLISPQMGLPFDFIFRDDMPDSLITLQLTYKLSCH